MTNLETDNLDTISKRFWARVEKDSEKLALREKDFGIWNEYTWRDYGDRARLVGHGLKALGLERGDVCSIASEVNKEWFFADLGVIGMGGVTNGVYPTDAPNQVEYLVLDSGTKFYFAEDEEQLDKILEVRANTPTLQKIIIFDMEGLRNFSDTQCISFEELLEIGQKHYEANDSLWEQEIQKAAPDDLMILTYTSGTTGPPKGAMISQSNMLFMAENLTNIYGVYPQDEQLAFLPLAHIAGRMFYTFLPIQSGSVVNLVEELETAHSDQQEVSPTIHFAVPRVWEKQHSMVTIKLKEGTVFGRWAYDLAIRVGAEAARLKKDGIKPGAILSLANKVLDLLVLKNIRILLGIDKCRWLSTAAAPIAPELIDWFWALGKPMYEVYGQTECTGIATANIPGENRIGSVGRANSGVEVAVSKDQEILIKGPGVIQGYWNKPEKTAETFIDGWLHTGDVGKIDDDGYIYIVDRIKDIIITAGGKNITPSEIENQLKFSPFISDAVVVGDRRPYLTCLVMIDQENVENFAQSEGVPFTNYTSLCHTSQVQDLIWQEIEKVNSKFARVETIKKFRLIDQLLDPEDDELTPTMKLKRKVVNEKYIDLINEMY
ncbi:MAG: AMP-binding protein [Halieaceae bacterium]|nr:AMP-binding protein [Halieaceae bacterium]